MDDPRWLGPAELRAWISLVAMSAQLPVRLESELAADDLSFFEYGVLAALSEEPDGSMRMSDLAGFAQGSLSRLSHGARRLEARGLVRRAPDPTDGRWTRAHLTDVGRDRVRDVAPRHVASVRALVLDHLSEADVADLERIAGRLLGAWDPALLDFVRSRADLAGGTDGTVDHA